MEIRNSFWVTPSFICDTFSFPLTILSGKYYYMCVKVLCYDVQDKQDLLNWRKTNVDINSGERAT